MFPRWRLTLRKATHALRLGQLQEVCRIVTAPEVQSYRQARELKGQVATALAQRAAEHLRQGDSQRAWKDLLQAEQIDGTGERLREIREELVRYGIEEVLRYLRDGQPKPALDCLRRLSQRGEDTTERRRLHEAATGWCAGREQARAGRFDRAMEHFETVRGLLPDWDALEQAAQEAWAARERMATLEAELHRALAAQDWQAALAASDDILKLAPEHVQARAARRRAWMAVGAPVSNIGTGGQSVASDVRERHAVAPTILRPPGAPCPQPHADTEGQPDETPGAARGRRFLLWIDGVGGYLVCMGDRVSIGQPAGWHVDVPIMADLSRLHAWLERDGEGYVLKAARPAVVNGQPVREQATLRHGTRITLGQSLRLRFCQPSPLSVTARLEFESRHRLAVTADAVLLMAETLIVGPNTSAHVVAPRWTREVAFFRQEGALWCRTPGDFEVDGQPCRDRACLALSSRIRGEGFSLALEPLAT